MREHVVRGDQSDDCKTAQILCSCGQYPFPERMAPNKLIFEKGQISLRIGVIPTAAYPRVEQFLLFDSPVNRPNLHAYLTPHTHTLTCRWTPSSQCPLRGSDRPGSLRPRTRRAQGPRRNRNLPGASTRRQGNLAAAWTRPATLQPEFFFHTNFPGIILAFISKQKRNQCSAFSQTI